MARHLRANNLYGYTSLEARARAETVERARRSIPVNTYLAMLNTAALTGKIPEIDPKTGQPTGREEPIAVSQRLEIAQFLLDKAIPSLKRVEPVTPDDLPGAAEDGAIGVVEVEALPSDKLRAVIATAKAFDAAQHSSAAPATSPS
jgi:hypothetical protein